MSGVSDLMGEISILLYVYNCGSFLKDSLDSLINQSFQDFEIFCIDDESDDNSLEILMEYSKKYARIRYISINHLGFSKAMNEALNSAKSKYIYIMKPSTCLKPTALEILFKQAEKNNVDMIFTDLNYQYDTLYYNKSDSINQIQQNVNKQVFDYKELKNLLFAIDPSLENKFYRLDFLKNQQIKFFNDLIYPEHLFFYNSLLRAKKISFLNEFLFEYIKPFEFLKKDEIKIKNIFKEYGLILDRFREFNEFDNYKNNFLELKLSFFLREYSRIPEDYQEYFFNILKRDLIGEFLSDEFEDISLEFLSNFNRKLFEQIIISENIYEFKLLRKNLFMTNEFNTIVDRKSFLKSIGKVID